MILEHGGGVVPASWIEATRSGNHSIFKEPYTFSIPNGAYKNQFWIEDPTSRAILAKGVFGQLIYVNWDYNMVVVKLSSWPDFLNRPFDVATFSAMHAIGKSAFLIVLSRLRERKGPTAKRWGGEGTDAGFSPSSSHCYAMGPFFSRFTGEERCYIVIPGSFRPCSLAQSLAMS